MRRGSAPAGAAEEGQRLAPYGRALLNWYDAHRRLLPWRLDAAPYRVWVSEIMLQQTRIEAVLPYFDRFMRQLPTIRDLAACGEDRLLKLWEGLGYYSRARNLQKAARVILEQYGGEMPGDYEALLGLPGIGEYTAGAVASISFGIPVPAVDGNVMGETVCLPNAEPRCGDCPLAGACFARERGIARQLPVRAPKKARRVEQRTILVCIDEGTEPAVLLHRREPAGLLGGLWELPGTEGWLTAEEAEAQARAFGLRTAAIEPLGEGKHIFSHIEWRMQGYRLTVERGTAAGDGWVWATGAQVLGVYALPSAFRAYAARLPEWLRPKTEKKR